MDIFLTMNFFDNITRRADFGYATKIVVGNTFIIFDFKTHHFNRAQVVQNKKEDQNFNCI